MVWNEVWETLGIEHPSDERTIRRAYAKRLRVTNPEDNPDGFKKLREAYDSALKWNNQPVWQDDDDGEFDQTPSPIRPIVHEVHTEPVALRIDADAADLRALNQQSAVEEVFKELHKAQNLFEEHLTGPWATDGDLRDEITAIWNHPSIDLNVIDQIEGWTADVLSRNIKEADGLLRDAVHQYDWDQPNIARNSSDISAIFRRLEEHDYIHALNQPDNPLHEGWKELTRQPKFLRTEIAGFGFRANSIRRILSVTKDHYPGVAWSMNAKAKAYWEEFLTKPRLGGLSVFIGAFSAAIFLLQVFDNFLHHDRSDYYFPALGAFGITAPWLTHHFIRIPNRRWIANNGWNDGMIATRKWVGLGILTTLLAAGLNISIASLSIVILLSIISVGWMLIQAPPESGAFSFKQLMTYIFSRNLRIIILMGVTLYSVTAPLRFIAVAIMWLAFRSYGRVRLNALVFDRLTKNPDKLPILALAIWMIAIFAVRFFTGQYSTMGLAIVCLGFAVITGMMDEAEWVMGNRRFFIMVAMLVGYLYASNQFTYYMVGRPPVVLATPPNGVRNPQNGVPTLQNTPMRPLISTYEDIKLNNVVLAPIQRNDPELDRRLESMINLTTANFQNNEYKLNAINAIFLQEANRKLPFASDEVQMEALDMGAKRATLARTISPAKCLNEISGEGPGLTEEEAKSGKFNSGFLQMHILASKPNTRVKDELSSKERLLLASKLLEIDPDAGKNAHRQISGAEGLDAKCGALLRQIQAELNMPEAVMGPVLRAQRAPKPLPVPPPPMIIPSGR